MVSTFSQNLRLELIATGEQEGVWGDTTNDNLGLLLEQAISGVAAITHDNTQNFTLTALDGALDQARNAVLIFDGTLTAARNAIVPSVDKVYIVRNNANQNITLKTAAGTGVTLAPSDVRVVFCDGTNVQEASSQIGPGSIGTAELADNSVTNAKIADNAVTSNKLAANSVNTSEIVNGAVIGTKIANDAVTSNKILNGAVTREKIQAMAVSSPKIANDAVTAQKLAANSVGSSEIQTGAVGLSEISQAAEDALMGNEVSTTSNAAATTFPIGHEVAVVFNGTNPNRNSSSTIRLQGSTQYTNTGSGAALTGTWRSRGQAGRATGQNLNTFIYQRVA